MHSCATGHFVLNNAFPFEQGTCRNNVTAGSQRMLLYQIRFPAVNAFPFQLEKKQEIHGRSLRFVQVG